jgi:hypothetical protein
VKSYPPAVIPSTARSFLGKSVLMELVFWDTGPEVLWRFFHIVGVVLPLEGVNEQGYFLTMDFNGRSRFPDEVFFSDIRTIRVVPYRDAEGRGM